MTGRTTRRITGPLVAALTAAILAVLPLPAQAERPWVDDPRGDGPRGHDVTRARYDYSGPYVGADVDVRRLARRGTVRQEFFVSEEYLTLSYQRRRDGSEVRRAWFEDRGGVARVRCPVTGSWDRTRDRVTLRVSFSCVREDRHFRGTDLSGGFVDVHTWRGDDGDRTRTRWVERN